MFFTVSQVYAARSFMKRVVGHSVDDFQDERRLVSIINATDTSVWCAWYESEDRIFIAQKKGLIEVKSSTNNKVNIVLPLAAEYLYVSQSKDSFGSRLTDSIERNISRYNITNIHDRDELYVIKHQGIYELVDKLAVPIAPPPIRKHTLNARKINTTNVRLSYDLAKSEKKFLKKRKVKIAKSFQDNLKIEVSANEKVPIISLAGSGGGIRALIGFFGAITALKEIGVFDLCSYISGVSGSTWLISTLYSQKEFYDDDISEKIPFTKLRNYLIDRLQTNFVSDALYDLHGRSAQSKIKALGKVFNINIDLEDEHDQIKQFREKRGGSLSLVDDWGLALGKKFFGTEDDTFGFNKNLSSFRSVLLDASLPFPICTAVTPDQQGVGGYKWFEFTPYEVGSFDYGAFIPTELFGALFKQGLLQESDFQEYSLGFLCGIYGSAFAFTWHRALKTTSFSTYAKKLKLLQNKHPVSVGEFNNFMYGLQHSNHPLLLSGADKISLLDAGIHRNLPIRSLMKRKSNLIIAVNIFPERDGNCLVETIEDAKKLGYSFPLIGDPKKLDDKKVTILEDVTSNDTPTIIYIPNVSELFPTSKFAYEKSEFLRLFTDMYAVIMQHQEDIITACKNTYKKVNSLPFTPLRNSEISQNEFAELKSSSLMIKENQKLRIFLDHLFKYILNIRNITIDDLEKDAHNLADEKSISSKLIFDTFKKFKEENKKYSELSLYKKIREIRDRAYKNCWDLAELSNACLLVLEQPLYIEKEYVYEENIFTGDQESLLGFLENIQKQYYRGKDEQKQQSIDVLKSFFEENKIDVDDRLKDSFVKQLMIHNRYSVYLYSQDIFDADLMLVDLYRMLSSKIAELTWLSHEVEENVFKNLLYKLRVYNSSMEEKARRAFLNAKGSIEGVRAAERLLLQNIKVERKSEENSDSESSGDEDEPSDDSLSEKVALSGSKSDESIGSEDAVVLSDSDGNQSVDDDSDKDN